MRATLIAPALVLTLAGYASFVNAQTTAGSGTTLVIPVTSQSASFVSEVTVFNPGPTLLTASVKFYEANNSSVPGSKSCNDLSVSANRSVQFQLATQCALGAGDGSRFGLIVITDKAVPPTHAFYGYSRVQNPQGIGFSVEGFPVQDFNNQVSHATGLKKQAATPTYQTNCFVASLDQAVSYELKLFNDATGAQIGGTLAGSLQPFQQFRYLDVFGSKGVNAPAGDRTNVRAQFTQTSGGSANLIGFCTVQDNMSFGADFRIAKSFGSPSSSFFAQGGNAFGTTALLGTTDNQPLNINVNGQRVMRYEYVTRPVPTDATSPNVIGGHSGNSVTAGAFGGAIGGGGAVSGPLPSSAGFIFCHYLAGGSCLNQVTDAFGTIGGGAGNQAGNAATGTDDSTFATVGGGAGNIAGGAFSTVGGGILNQASGDNSFIGGGVNNIASGLDSVVMGGFLNHATNTANTVAGGFNNTTGGISSTVAGGGQDGDNCNDPPSGLTRSCGNGALSDYATVGGGHANQATGASSIVAGGANNTALGPFSAVSGGDSNIALGYGGTVAGGVNNVVGGFAFWGTVAGGQNNFASGLNSTVVGGSQNTASGDYSFAAGVNATAAGQGSFAIADQSTVLRWPVAVNNSFGARYTGGFTFATSVNGSTGLFQTGCQLFGGTGIWSCTSDRATKTAFTPIDARAILRGVATLPIAAWRFHGEPGHVRHIGPSSQDFYGAFGLSHDDKSISTVDAQGIALAAIQGLHQVVQEKDTRIDTLEQTVAELRRKLELMSARIGME